MQLIVENMRVLIAGDRLKFVFVEEKWTLTIFGHCHLQLKMTYF